MRTKDKYPEWFINESTPKYLGSSPSCAWCLKMKKMRTAIRASTAGQLSPQPAIAPEEESPPPSPEGELPW